MSDNPPNPDSRKVFTLYELTKSLESVISKAYQRSYWIRGEIAKLNFYPKSGHCYPDLVEKENGVTRAQIRATIWAGPFQDIRRKFLEVTRENLTDGMKVLFLASVHFHPTHGLTLQISDIDPSFSLGEMARERNQSVARLKKEALFDLNHQLVFPLLPLRVAIISVETSKGYHDFMKTMNENQQGYQLFTMLFPALLQGEGAIISIRQQLARIKKVKHHFDVVILIRGGGGDIGLSCFDNFSLASAVASFPLPVITGIGHATNETVVELVAHSNKITPTEVAYFLLHQFDQYAWRIADGEIRLMEKMNDILTEENQLLNYLADRMINRTSSLISHQQHQLNRSGLVLEKELKSKIFHHTLQISRLSEKTTTSIRHLLLHQNVKLNNRSTHLIKTAPRKTASANQIIEVIVEKVRLLNPVNILKRGFSITLQNGKPITKASDLIIGVEIETQYHNGKSTSTVKKIEP